MKKIVKLSLAILFFMSANVHAALIVYTDRAAFQNDAGNLVSFEGFEGPNWTFETSLTVSGFGSAYPQVSTNKPTQGAQSLSLVETSATTFSLSQPTYAFGFDVIELNAVSLDYADSAGNVLSSVVPTNSGVQFFGIISDLVIDTFTLGSGTDEFGSLYFVDALEVRAVVPTSSVPAPASLALLGIGLAGICFSRKK